MPSFMQKMWLKRVFKMLELKSGERERRKTKMYKETLRPAWVEINLGAIRHNVRSIMPGKG